MSNIKNSAIKNITAALLCVALAIGAGCMIKIHRDKKSGRKFKKRGNLRRGLQQNKQPKA